MPSGQLNLINLYLSSTPCVLWAIQNKFSFIPRSGSSIVVNYTMSENHTAERLKYEFIRQYIHEH
jgi:hypothetical protein